ncbi:hypothetical protein SASPL_123382 [Salvia splendens]|uniref:Amino acid transporter transmembrane domain-containing protein n=1 Tax=Salvia splendens TaxID=180675 RepID=A0A8X8ZTC8_SALSN|nr:hypothetical protein SASPL_123382 [Salvia splendens]
MSPTFRCAAGVVRYPLVEFSRIRVASGGTSRLASLASSAAHSLSPADSLRHASAISVLLAAFFVVICSVMAIHALWVGETKTPRLLPDFSGVHPIRAELGRPSDMSSAVRISLILCVAIYFSVGFFGYLLFGESIMADMLVNFDKTSDSVMGIILNNTVRLSYAIHLMLVFPVMNYSLRVNVDELLFPTWQQKTSDFCPSRDNNGHVSDVHFPKLSRSQVWPTAYFISLPRWVKMNVFLMLKLCRDVHCMSTRRDKALAVLVIILAVGTSLVAIFSNLSDYFGFN